jgi:hypothetical protein
MHHMNYILRSGNYETAPAFDLIYFFVDDQSDVDPNKEIMHWFIQTYAPRMCCYLQDRQLYYVQLV